VRERYQRGVSYGTFSPARRGQPWWFPSFWQVSGDLTWDNSTPQPGRQWLFLYCFAQDWFSASLANGIGCGGVQSVPKRVQKGGVGEKALNKLLDQLKPWHVPSPSHLLSVWHNIEGADKGAPASLAVVVGGDITPKHSCFAALPGVAACTAGRGTAQAPMPQLLPWVKGREGGFKAPGFVLLKQLRKKHTFPSVSPAEERLKQRGGKGRWG